MNQAMLRTGYETSECYSRSCRDEEGWRGRTDSSSSSLRGGEKGSRLLHRVCRSLSSLEGSLIRNRTFTEKGDCVSYTKSKDCFLKSGSFCFVGKLTRRQCWDE